jgi:integrase
MSGTITRRGKSSWRIKFELPRDASGERRIGYQTIKGRRQDAEKALRARLTMLDKGIAIAPRSLTVRDYLDQWLTQVAVRSCGAKARARYAGLIRNQIDAHLGGIELQKLRPADIDRLLQTLAGTGISVRTIRHAFGVLRVALNHAVAVEIIERNVCTVVRPPTQPRQEVEILKGDQIGAVLAKLAAAGDWLAPIAVLGFGSGARRGELVALRWCDLDLDAGTLRVERSFEQVGRTITVKAPKTKAGVRTITLPVFALQAMRDHRRATLEMRLALGLGKLPDDAPILRSGDRPSGGARTDQPHMGAAPSRRQLSQLEAFACLGLDRRRPRRRHSVEAARAREPEHHVEHLQPPIQELGRRGRAGHRCCSVRAGRHPVTAATPDGCIDDTDYYCCPTTALVALNRGICTGGGRQH